MAERDMWEGQSVVGRSRLDSGNEVSVHGSAGVSDIINMTGFSMWTNLDLRFMLVFLKTSHLSLKHLICRIWVQKV